MNHTQLERRIHEQTLPNSVVGGRGTSTGNDDAGDTRCTSKVSQLATCTCDPNADGTLDLFCPVHGSE